MRPRLSAVAALAAWLSAALGAASTPAGFEPPPAGSYELPPIDRVSDHDLLGSDGRKTTLFAEKGGRLSVVAFVYRSCPEAHGCPLSMATLGRLDSELASDSALAAGVEILTVSFDPGRDTPGQMARWRARFEPRSQWRFLTAQSDEEIAPLLEDFGQTVARLDDPEGRPTDLLRHVLKVFVLDRRNRVRNVYGAEFLNTDLILNDLRTLLGEETAPPATPPS